MQSILLIDDHEDFRSIMATILSGANYDVWQASCPEKAFQLLDHEQPHLIICDLHMPFTDNEEMHDFQYSYEVGLKTVEELRWALPEVPLMITSAAIPTDLKKATAHLNSVIAMSKPINPKKLLVTVELLLQPNNEMVLH
jgi:CheY-like chemotaxis protein